MVMTRKEFDVKWAGKHPDSWNHPDADEWLQDFIEVEESEAKGETN